MSAMIDSPTMAAPAVLQSHLRQWQLVGLGAMAAWLAVFVAWLVWAPISGAVVAGGSLKVDSDRQSVSHRDGGIVSRIRVREGQLVKAGDTLVELEDARVDASLKLLVSQRDLELLRQSRLSAEASFATDWRLGDSPRVVEAARREQAAAAREKAAFATRRRAHEAQVASAVNQARDTQAEIVAQKANVAALAEAMELQREEIRSNEALLKENFVNQARLQTLQRALAEYTSRRAAAEAEMSQARQRLMELEGRQASLRLGYVHTATDELRETNARLVDLEARLQAAQDAADRQRVVAPVDGRLVGLRVNTVGSAVGPREAIVDIVPTAPPLRVEAKLQSDAVTDVRVGQDVEIRLPGRIDRAVGLLYGRVLNVSPDTLTDSRTGIPYFAVLVELLPESLERVRPFEITAGMAAEVFIVTSRRSTLQFLVEPLTAGMRRAFRER